MKLIKARRSYKCNNCKQAIKKGDKYSKKSVSIGSPHKPDQVKKDDKGIVYFAMQGIRIPLRHCEQCSLGG